MLLKKSLLAIALPILTIVAQAQTLRPIIDLNTAKVLAAGCEAIAKSEGWKMNIAIADNGGNLTYLAHMDDSFKLSIHIAQLKAQTSALTPLSTRQYRDISKIAPGLERIPSTTTVAGGFPIMNSKGQQLGGIGVSGGTEDQDEKCAKAGLEAAKELLK